MPKRVIKIMLLLVGLASLLAFLITIKPEEIVGSLQILNFSLLGTICGVTLFNILLKAMRWKILVRYVSGKEISHSFAFLSIIAGVAGSSIFPGRMDLVKPLLLKEKKGISLTQSMPLLLAERMLDFFVIASLLFVTALFLPARSFFGWISPIAWILAGVAVMCLVFIVSTAYLPAITKFALEKIPFPEKIKRILSDLERHSQRTSSLLTRKKIGSYFLLLSITAIILEVLRLHIILRTLGVDSAPFMTGFAFAVAVVAGIVSLIPGGIGVTEFSYTGILLFLIPSASSAAIKSSVLLNRFFAYYLLVVIGSIILLFYFKKSLRKEQPNAIFDDKDGQDMVKIKE